MTSFSFYFNGLLSKNAWFFRLPIELHEKIRLGGLSLVSKTIRPDGGPVFVKVVFRKFHQINRFVVSKLRGAAPRLLRALHSAVFFPGKEVCFC